MANYVINYSGGTITLTSGNANTATGLTLMGQNYANYGEPMNQNWMSLLENFASNASPPSLVVQGMIWYDAANTQLKINTSNSTANWQYIMTTGAPNGNMTVDSLIANTVTSDYFIGDGSNVSNINASNITSGTLSNARLSGTYNIDVSGSANTANYAGNITVASQPNITSVGTLTSLAVAGNTTAGNANIAGDLDVGGNIDLTGTLNGNVLGYVRGTIQAPGSNTQLAFNNQGNLGASANLTFNGSTLTVTGNANATVFNGSGAGLTNIPGANVTGTVSYSAVSNSVAAANVVGTVANAAYATNAGNATFATSATVATSVAGNSQPNITSVGSLTSLTVTGAASANSLTISTTANIQGNLNVGGTINGNINGNISGNISVPGSNTQVLFNNQGNVGASANLTFNGNVLSVIGNVSATNLSGNGAALGSLTGANVTGAVAFATTANTVAGSNVTGTVANASFSANAAYANVAGTVATNAQPNITSVGTLTTLNVNGQINANRLTSNVATGTAPLSVQSTTVVANLNADLLDGYNSSVPTVADTVVVRDGNGNIYANVLIVNTISTSTVVNGNSNVSIPAANGNVTIGVSGNSNVVVASGSGVQITGTLGVTGNANLGNVTAESAGFTSVSGNGAALTALNASNVTTGTLAQARLANSSLSVNGVSISLGGSGTITSNTTQTLTLGTHLLGGSFNGGTAVTASVDATSSATANKIVVRDADGSFSANVVNATIVNATINGHATTANAVTNASQPNITAVGTLTSLGVSGTITAASITANTGTFTGNGAGLTNINASSISSGTLDQSRLANSSLTVNGTSISLGGSATITANTTQTLGIGNYLTGASFNGSTATTWAVDAISTATPSKVVARDANGSFAANVITANSFSGIVIGDGANLANLNASNITTGTLAQARLANSSLTVNGTSISLGGSATITANTTQTLTRGTYLTGNSFNGGTAETWAVDATDAAIASKVVARDASGSFNANVITANSFVGPFTGNGASLTNLNASNITTGTLAQARLANSTIIVNGTTLTLGGTSTITANTTQTLTLGSYLTGTSFNGGTAVTANVDATDAATASKVVARDANGSFSANVITANSFSGPFTGNGANLTNLNASNITTGTLAQARLANSNVILGSTTLTLGSTVTTVTGLTNLTSTTLTGTLATAAQPNITSVGTLTALTVSGNANVGNIGATDGVFTGNVTANNLTTTNKVTAGNGLQVTTGSIDVLAGNLNVTGNINVTGNLNYSNVTDLVVGDPLIYIGANNTGDTVDLGIVASYNDGVYEHTGLARNAANDTWTFFDGVVAEPTTVIDWANATYPSVKLGNLIATGNANITGTANITGNANVGNIGATNGVFTSVSGNGAALTALNASNITSGTLAQARLANSSLTVNGTSISLGGSATITANTTQSHSNGSYITGGSFNGGTAVTWAVDATDAATASKVVARDANGSFSANVITANSFIGPFTGNGASLTNLNASNITTGTLAQARLANSSLTVNGTSISLGGSATITANTTQTLTLGSFLTGTSFNGGTAVTANVDATSAATANKVVSRDANGSFAANVITANTFSGIVIGDGANIANLNASNITSGTLAQARLANSSLTVNGTSISLGGSATITANTTQTHSNGSYLTGGSFNGGTAITWAVDATDAATASKVVARDVNGSFSANVITANSFSGPFTGNGANLTNINASNITTGTLAQARLANSSLTVNGTSISLGGSATITANTTQSHSNGSYLTGGSFNGGTAVTWAVDATDAATASKVVARDANGSFSANVITANSFSGPFTGNGANLTNLNASNITTGTLSQARLANSSLTVNGTSISLGGSATITANTTQSHSNGSYITGGSFNGGTAITWAVDATDAATASKVVARDANGSFSANVITANSFSGPFTGNGANLTNLNASNITTGTLSQARLANSSLTVNGTSISLGGSGTITANTTNSLTFNNGGSGATSGSTFNGGSAVTISYNSVGAPSTTGTNASGTWSINITGSAGSAGTATSATTAGTVTTAAQPNITSVGSLTSLTSTGNISGANIIASAYMIGSVQTGISAAGSTQGTATALTKQYNIVSTVTAGQGVVLPAAVAGMRITVINTSSANLLIYPASTAQINSLGTNAGFTLGGNTNAMDFVAATGTQWYSINAVYA